ncbi:MAG: type II toxin-antitoxin system RelE/ParE family toxin [Amaricoccus sp.]|uniref:type II toxin-antitoxin system RelE/ParE family toxin n=1 Tax=Amaricoccus sp. TaxID=1872485 RepID=UPI0039E23B3D
MARVRFSRRALADLAAIHEWLSERSPAAADRVVNAIEDSAAHLADNPLMGKREARGLGRFLIVSRYRYVLSYRVEGDRVEIVYVFHPSRER